MKTQFQPRQKVTHDGRPAEIHTHPVEGLTGEAMIGVRYTDVPQWEPVPGFPNMQKPARGSVRIVPVAELVA